MLNPHAALSLLAAAPAGEGGLLSVEATLLWATVVIFLVFALVLGKFAWGPLLKIVDERERNVRDQVEAAERAAAEGRELVAKHQELLRNAGRERDEILARAVKDAEQLRGELAAKARADAEAIALRAREQMHREKDQAIAELRAQVAEIAVEAASRIVKSSLDAETQRRLADDYIRSLPRAQG